MFVDDFRNAGILLVYTYPLKKGNRAMAKRRTRKKAAVKKVEQVNIAVKNDGEDYLIFVPNDTCKCPKCGERLYDLEAMVADDDYCGTMCIDKFERATGIVLPKGAHKKFRLTATPVEWLTRFTFPKTFA